MKKVFVANKRSYGAEFFNECSTLEALKRDIVYHEIGRYADNSYTRDMYTEELFKENSKDYELFEVDLHEEEFIEWHEYDGQSWFTIEKIDPNILSRKRYIEKDEL